MKKLFSSTLIVGMLLSASSAHAFKIEIPGIKLPPPSEWDFGHNPKFDIGGSIGSLWEGNKEAIRYSAAGMALLGPVGLIAGFHVGSKNDIQKRNMLKTLKLLEEQQALVKEAGAKWPEEAHALGQTYAKTSNQLAALGAASGYYEELGKYMHEGVWCLIEADTKRDALRCALNYSRKADNILEDAL